MDPTWRPPIAGAQRSPFLAMTARCINAYDLAFLLLAVLASSIRYQCSWLCTAWMQAQELGLPYMPDCNGALMLRESDLQYCHHQTCSVLRIEPAILVPGLLRMPFASQSGCIQCHRWKQKFSNFFRRNPAFGDITAAGGSSKSLPRGPPFTEMVQCARTFDQKRCVGKKKHTHTLTAAPDSQPNLDLDRSQLEAAQPAPEFHGVNPGALSGSAPFQGPGEGQEQGQDQGQRTEDGGDQEGILSVPKHQLQDLISKLVLINPNNWCFCNAAAYSLCWTILSLSCYEPAFWGLHCNELMRFLTGNQTPLNLAAQPFFREIMQTWGRDAIGSTQYSISQQDSSEFVQVWLTMTQTPAFKMQWEKRVSVAEETQVLDSCSEAFCPPCLKFDDVTVHSEFCNLTTLVHIWHQVDGMKTALLHPSPCLCVHIDRCTLSQDTRVYKCTSKLQIEDACFFPVFQDDSVACEFHEYTTVAVMSHLGHDGSGHYRTAMRLRPMILSGNIPAQWLLTDDWRAPEPVWMPKDWMRENVTMAWMVRSDLVHLPLFRAEPEKAASSTAELMRLLTEAATKGTT